MEKSCPGQEGHPPSRVNFSERLYEKNVDPLPESRAGFPMTAELVHALIDRLVLIELTRLGGPKCLYGEKLAGLGG